MQKKGTSYSLYRRKFFDKYKNQIVPLVRKYETMRKTRLMMASILFLVLFVLASFILYLVLTNKINGKNSEIAGYLYLGAFASCYFVKKKFENSIKTKIMPSICSCFENMSWSCDLYEQGELFSQAGVVPKFNSSTYDDVFTGVYKDVNYEIVEAGYVAGSGKYRSVVFDGVIVKIDLNKPFKSHTVIKPDALLNISPVKDLRHTQLEDAQFNKKFDVYTNDEIEARVLITPIFMERLKNMKMVFSSSAYSCAFYQQYLIIALSTKKDLFSLCSLIKPIDDKEQYKKLYDEVLSIIKLIDYFKLDKK